VVAKARWAEAAGYDAMVISCMRDPGVADARKTVRMHVVGLGEANDAVAGLLGRRPVRFYPIGLPVQQLGHDEQATYSELTRVARRCVEKNAADVLIPNCARLGGLAWRLQNDLDVPVLPNEVVGIKLAELLVVLGVRRSHGHGPARLRARLRRVAAGIYWRIRS
jgi:allantoin racemase